MEPTKLKYPPHPLNPEVLLRLGFEEVEIKMGKNWTKKGWRLKVPYYAFQIQVELGDYPADNPNCGIVSIHSPKEEAGAIPDDLVKKIDWTADDMKRAAAYTVTLPEWTQPIAWHVHTPERLKHIIVALSTVNL